jgi:hypothetical protein
MVLRLFIKKERESTISRQARRDDRSRRVW